MPLMPPPTTSSAVLVAAGLVVALVVALVIALVIVFLRAESMHSRPSASTDSYDAHFER